MAIADFAFTTMAIADSAGGSTSYYPRAAERGVQQSVECHRAGSATERGVLGGGMQSPQDAHDPMPASSTASPQATGCLMQCVDCKILLCGTEELAFFKRVNQQGGVEVN